jgi:hypothetical protein
MTSGVAAPMIDYDRTLRAAPPHSKSEATMSTDINSTVVAPVRHRTRPTPQLVLNQPAQHSTPEEREEFASTPEEREEFAQYMDRAIGPNYATMRRIDHLRRPLIGARGNALFDALNGLMSNAQQVGPERRKWHLLETRIACLDLLRREWMPFLSGNQYKMLDAIIDRTMGWGLIARMISRSVFACGARNKKTGELNIEEKTALPLFSGLGQREQAIDRTSAALVEQGFIARFKTHHPAYGECWAYHLNIDWPSLFGCLDALNREVWNGQAWIDPAWDDDGVRIGKARRTTARMVALAVVRHTRGGRKIDEGVVREVVAYVQQQALACAQDAGQA